MIRFSLKLLNFECSEVDHRSTKLLLTYNQLFTTLQRKIFAGKVKQGKNGISGFVQNILSSKKKASNLKRGNNLPTMRIQVTSFVFLFTRFGEFIYLVIKKL